MPVRQYSKLPKTWICDWCAEGKTRLSKQHQYRTNDGKYYDALCRRCHNALVAMDKHEDWECINCGRALTKNSTKHTGTKGKYRDMYPLCSRCHTNDRHLLDESERCERCHRFAWRMHYPVGDRGAGVCRGCFNQLTQALANRHPKTEADNNPMQKELQYYK